MTKEEAVIQGLQGHVETLNETIEKQDKIIKALKQQTSDDCVSRESVKKWLHQHVTINLPFLEKEMFEQMEKELPPAILTQKWIPVSEKLPDTKETVLCWYEYYHWSQEKVLPEYGLGYYFKEVGTWGGEVASGLKAKVLAWQPLPKPYEEK